MKKVTFNHRVGQAASIAYDTRMMWLTSYDYSRRMHVSQSYASRILRHMVKAGIMEVCVDHTYRKNTTRNLYRMTANFDAKYVSKGYARLFQAMVNEIRAMRKANGL